MAVDPAAERSACAFAAGALARETMACPASGSDIPIQHVIVLMQENRSFDHYLGHLPGRGQDDVDVPDDSAANPTSPGADGSGPPASVSWYHAGGACFDNPNQSWSSSHAAWDQGRNDGFVIASSGANDAEGNDPTGRRAMGYYDDGDIPFYYQLASTFAISDRYFSDLLGPTLPNRLYLYAGSSFGIVDGDADLDLHDTIFHELDARNISWKVYQSDVAAGFLTASFLLDSIGHLASLDDFAADARNGTLPAVAWVDPAFLGDAATRTDEEPPADMQVGQQFVYRQVSALMSSPSWATSALFITYDEAGGMYDHVAPPAACPPDGICGDGRRRAGGIRPIRFPRAAVRRVAVREGALRLPRRAQPQLDPALHRGAVRPARVRRPRRQLGRDAGHVRLRQSAVCLAAGARPATHRRGRAGDLPSPLRLVGLGPDAASISRSEARSPRRLPS